MAPLSRFQAVERGFAHVAERRSPQAGIFATSLVESVALQAAPTPAFLERRDTITGPSGAPVVSIPSLTNSAKALTWIIVVIAIVVLGVAVFKLRGCIRRRAPSRSRSLKPLSLCSFPVPEKITSEKRNQLYPQVLIDLGYDSLQPLEKAHLQHPIPLYSDMDMTAGWVPQIRSRPNGEGGSPKSLSTLLPPPKSTPPPSPPAPVVHRVSRLSRLVAAVVRSPPPSDTSFHIVPLHSPPSSTSSSKSTSPISVSPAASSASLIVEGPHSKKMKKQKQKQKQKPPRLTRPGTPHSKTQHVSPASSDNPLPVITIAEVTRLLAAAEPNAEPLKSPTRQDSARPAQAVQSLKVDQHLLIPKPLGKRNSSPSNRSTRIASTYENIKHAIASVKSPRVSAVRKSVIGAADRKLPCLVVVIHLYKPSMPDELLVRRDEVLWMTEEFLDGWCEVQRLGGTDSEMETGVVPRFCVVVDRLAQSQPHLQPHTLGSRFSASTTYVPVSGANVRTSCITTRSSNGSL